MYNDIYIENLSENSRKTKERILYTAIDLFSVEGFSAVSVRDLTRKVGIKESSLYNHFKNKDTILETIYTLFKIEFAKALPPLERIEEILSVSEPEAFLRRGYENYKALFRHDVMGKMWRIIHIEQYRDSRAREIIMDMMINKTLEFLEGVFSIWIRQGKVKALDPKLLAAEYQYPVFSLMTEYNLLAFSGESTEKIEQLMEGHISFILDHILLR